MLKSSQTGFFLFSILKWPLQSPDLIPIEHLWSVVKQDIYITDVQSTNHVNINSMSKSLSTLLNLIRKELRQFWSKKGVEGVNSKAEVKCILYLLQWLIMFLILWCFFNDTIFLHPLQTTTSVIQWINYVLTMWIKIQIVVSEK